MAKEFNKAANLILDARKSEVLPQNNDDFGEYAENVEFKTERTQILFRKSTKKALKQLAKKKTQGSLNELVNRICEEYIKEHLGQ